MKENREKRRAQQAQILEEQEQLRNKDPGNPNWEFLQMILDYKDELEFNPLQDGDPIANHQITVAIRKRPMSQKEIKIRTLTLLLNPQEMTLQYTNQSARLTSRSTLITSILGKLACSKSHEKYSSNLKLMLLVNS